MGNEFTSPRRDEDDTVTSGVSGWSHDTREKFKATLKSRRNRRDSFQPSNLFDNLCGRMVFDDEEEDYDRKKGSKKKLEKSRRKKRSGSDEYSEEDEAFTEESDFKKSVSKDRSSDRESSKKSYSRSHDEESLESYDEDSKKGRRSHEMEDSVDEVSGKVTDGRTSFDLSRENGIGGSNNASPPAHAHSKPLASAFAKRCYFTKAGIGPLTQHYEGLTMAGNTVLMLASAMKLKGCPTICDEDLRRVEQTYPNQFSRLPDELLLSSGWRRISKYCHFSGKPIPDGVAFFHSKERLHHQTAGYYFLLASSLGMERPSEVEPLTIDMLILLQADYPSACEQAPKKLLEDPNQWTLVTKFCFFSGGPINAEEDVYYEANFDGNPIYMLAFLSPNLTPEELYRLNDITGETALKTVAAVEEVDEVYNLTDRDFDDLKLYHLGPCRALPNYILSPEAWTKVLPRSFVECREKALARAYEYEAHAQQAVAAAGRLIGKGPLGQTYSETQEEDVYVEFKKGHYDGSHDQHDRISYSASHDNGTEDDDIMMQHSDDVNEEKPDSVYEHSRSRSAEEIGMQTNVMKQSLTAENIRSHSPTHHENDQSEEFPDPEIDMDALSDDIPMNGDEPDTRQHTAPPHDTADPSESFMEEQMPMDEAMIYGKPMNGHSNMNGHSKIYGSPHRDKVELVQNRRRSITSTSQDRTTLPRKSQTDINSISPEYKTSDNFYPFERLKVDTHGNNIVDISDKSCHNLELISPMSNSSPSAHFVTSGDSTPLDSDSGKPSNSYTKSSAMRGAHELLKKNRQQRLAIMAKRKGGSGASQHNSSMTDSGGESMPADTENVEFQKPKLITSRSRGRSVTPLRRVKSPTKLKSSENETNRTSKSPKSKSKVKMTMYRSNSSSRERLISERSSKTLGTEVSSPEKETTSRPTATSPVSSPRNLSALKSLAVSSKPRDENDVKSDATSAVSGSSSVWTDTTDPSLRDTRRALILKMAKNRMKTKKENASHSEVTSGEDN